MELEVKKSTQSTRGGFVNTVEGTTVEKVFGAQKTTKHRFMIKTDEALEVGAKENIALSQYTQTVREFEGQNGQPASCVWLHRKAEA